MNPCPHCGQQISLWAKFMVWTGFAHPLEPRMVGSCPNCHQKFTLSWSGLLLASVPVVVAPVGAYFVESIPLKVAIYLIGALLTSILYLCWVPLISGK